MPRAKKIFLTTKDCIKVVEPEDLFDVLSALQENGFINSFQIDGNLTTVTSKFDKPFDICQLMNEDFEFLSRPKHLRKLI